MSVEVSQVQIDAIISAFRRSNQSSKILKPSSGNDFANKHFYISPESKGEYTGQWTSRPFQVEILNAMASFENKEVSWRKSSRMGASKMMLSYIAQCAAELSLNVIMYQPNDPSMDRFVKSEIDPMFRDVKILQDLKLSNSKKYDTMSLKQLRGFMLHMLGGATPDNYRARSADVVITDECSAFDQDIGGEGDSRALSRTRITESPFGKQINFSSPKVLPTCLISQAIFEMDFVFKFYVPCPSCGALQYMDYHDDDEKIGLTYTVYQKDKKKTLQSAGYSCTECRQKHTYAQMINVQHGGRWMTTDQKHYLKDGNVYSGDFKMESYDRWKIGFDSNSLISPAFSFSNYLEEYLAAKKRYDEGSFGPMKTLYQNRKGLPWEEQETINKLDHKLFITEHFADYGIVPSAAIAIFSAADVQGDRIEVGTVAYGPREESWWLDYKIFPGDTNKHEVWQRLQDYWYELNFKDEITGQPVEVFLKGLDHGGHWSDTVERFCRENGAREHIPLKGRLGHNNGAVDFPRTPSKKSHTWLTHINTDTTKQIVQRRLIGSMKTDFDIDIELDESYVQPGRIHFPEYGPGFELFDEKFFKQMVAETRKLKPNGSPEWIQNGTNETFDIASMNLALCRISQLPHYGLKFDVDASDSIIIKPNASSKSRKYDFRKIGVSLNRG